MTEGEIRKVVQAFIPRLTTYVKETPHPRQQLFLCLNNTLDVFYGGAGGGGKSVALLMAALQYVDCPGYSALIIRRTYRELAKSGAIMDRAHEWLANTNARWDAQNHTYIFPSKGSGFPNARLQFGYLETDRDRFQYQSAEYQAICFDELTEFEEGQFRFLFSRLRRAKIVTTPEGQPIPLRMRSASNPGGVGHDWVKARYIEPVNPDGSPARFPPDRAFVPAKIQDNPSIDLSSYEASLSHLNPTDRARIREGDWSIIEGGLIFDRHAFRVAAAPPGWDRIARVRAWDLAASAEGKRTAGVLMSRTLSGQYYVEHVVKGKWNPADRDKIILQTARLDRAQGGAITLLEEEGGSGGLAQNDALIRALAGYPVESVRVSGDKFARAAPFASQVGAGNVFIVAGPWNQEYLDEMHAASENAAYADQMDASSLAFNWLASARPSPIFRPPPPAPGDWRAALPEPGVAGASGGGSSDGATPREARPVNNFGGPESENAQANIFTLPGADSALYWPMVAERDWRERWDRLRRGD